jgi:anti-anti-sigma factor
MAVAFRPAEVLDLTFAVGSEVENGTTRLWLSGELDIAGIPLFVEELERLQRDGRDVDVLDLAELVFIDAVGLHAVTAVRERVSNGRPPPALIGAIPPVSRVFELVGLEHHLADRG